MKPTRRNLLAWGGGAVTGLAFTPVPWKLLDDTAKWTQNWSWIPQPSRGPVEIKQAACSLCPKGCGLRVRMAAGWPVGVAPASGHPVSEGALCPLAFGAHQLNWHPLRLREARHDGASASWKEARAAFRRACAEGPVAVVDGRPGRAASAVLERFAREHGSYHVAPCREVQALASYARWSGVPAGALGLDLDAAKTVVSFGAPLLDGWCAAGRFARRWAQREMRLIQIEPSLSHTAACAARWIANRPGSDAALAAGIARVLGRGRIPNITLAEAAEQSGVPVESIQDLGREIASGGPALAISGGDQPAVAALNLALGGSVVQREEAKAWTALAGAHRAILIDSSVPWEYEPMARGEVFRFAAWDGGGSRSGWLLPAAGFLEELSELPSAPASPSATYALSPRLVTPRHEVSNAVELVEGSLEDTVRARCERILRENAGTLHRRGETAGVPLAGVKLQEELLAGAVWVDDPKRRRPLRCDLEAWPETRAAQPAANWSSGWPLPVLPTLATKLFQESNLRPRPTRSRV
jgi:hypothetical protein